MSRCNRFYGNATTKTRNHQNPALSPVTLAVSAHSEQPSVVAQTSPTVEVTLTAVTTPINGPARQSATSEAKLDVGSTATLGFALRGNLCNRAIGGRTVVDATATHAWTVTVTLSSARIDKIAVDVAVERLDGQPLRVTRRELRQLLLSEGAPHVLDFIEADDEALAACDMKNIVLQVSAAVIERQAAVREPLDYDLWFTHTDAGGRAITRHAAVTGFQGKAVDFMFRPVRWPLQTLAPSSPADLSIDEEIYGTIRGRLQIDGAIDISLTTTRSLSHTYPNGSWGSTGNEGGRKNFSVRAGEPVALEIPKPSGSALLKSQDGSTMRANYSELFANHAASIIVRVSRN
jgi:hypothetical protein